MDSEEDRVSTRKLEKIKENLEARLKNYLLLIQSNSLILNS